MKFQDAEKLSTDVRRVSGALDSAAAIAQQIYSVEEFHDFRREIGMIMGEIYFLILKDIWDEFPELIPDGMEDS